MVKIEIKNQEKTLYEPIDIVYVPMKNKDDIINCYFTDHLYLAFRPHCSKGKKSKVELPDSVCFAAITFLGQINLRRILNAVRKMTVSFISLKIKI